MQVNQQIIIYPELDTTVKAITKIYQINPFPSLNM